MPETTPPPLPSHLMNNMLQGIITPLAQGNASIALRGHIAMYTPQLVNPTNRVLLKKILSSMPTLTKLSGTTTSLSCFKKATTFPPAS